MPVMISFTFTEQPATQVPLIQLALPVQARQLAASVVVATSHPSATLLSQSAKPLLQAMAQPPPTHEAVPLKAGQTVPQLPQLEVSVPRFTSHPSPSLLLLQSANPMSQT